MYWLTLISSVLGILSFIFSFIDKFKEYRRYLLHFTFLAIGFTVGILLSMTQTAIQQFSQSQLVYLIAFILILTLLILFIYRYMTHTNDVFLIALLVIVGISYFAVRLLNSVEASQSFIKSSDYLILSNHYLEKGDYIRSADFLKKYRDFETINLPNSMLDSIDKRIDALQYRGFEKIK